jgi:putative membrane protein
MRTEPLRIAPAAPGRGDAPPPASDRLDLGRLRRPIQSINTVMAGHTLRVAARLLAARRLDIRVEGLHHVPASGPVLLAARHYHHLYDGVALLHTIPRRLHVLVALDWVDSAGLRRLMEWATRSARWPTVLRSDALDGNAAGRDPYARSAFGVAEIERYRIRGLRDCVALLCEGAALVVFPEGYPNIDPRFTLKRTDGEFLPFRPGFTTAVAAAERRLGRRVPIVPVGLAYRSGIRTQVTLRCGAPLQLGGNRSAFARAVQAEVQALSM